VLLEKLEGPSASQWLLLWGEATVNCYLYKIQFFLIKYYNCPSVNTRIILKMTMLVIKYSYMFRLFLSHPQANVVTEFRSIKCAPNRIPLLTYLLHGAESLLRS